LASTPNLCETAAKFASYQTQVPISILLAVAQTESGRSVDGHLRAWPWAVNVHGKGHYFPSKTQAREFLAALLRSGETNFDVGCFQLNFRWHNAAFGTVDEMLNPESNALYAANFLSDLHNRSKDWLMAIGQYHSRTTALAEKYLAKVSGHLGNVESLNRFQGFRSNLLQRSTRQFPSENASNIGDTGSLVPLGSSESGNFFGIQGNW